MTFESIENTNDINMNAPAVEGLSVKVSYGGEIRRATMSGSGFAVLLELCSKLYGLEPASLVLKYQDDDGDKVTMSSDGELADALRLSVKNTNLLRVFLEVKNVAAPTPTPTPTPTPAPVSTPPQPTNWRGFPHHGSEGRGFGFGGRGFHHGPRGPFFPHHPARFGSFPRTVSNNNNSTPASPPPAGEASGAPCSTPPNASFYSPNVFNHGVFFAAPTQPCAASEAESPQAVDETPDVHLPHPHPFSFRGRDHRGHHAHHGHGGFPHHARGFPHPHHGNPHSMGPYAARCAFKEHKHEMKEQIKLMKENATTPEDREAIKDFKRQMKEECKAMWRDAKDAKKDMCNAEKWERKWEKKCQKAKHEGCKKNKEWKYVAKHVADVTVPDNSELPADAPVTKTWRLRNAGSVAWPEDSQLIFISRKGDNLNGPERVPVGRVEPGAEIDVSVTFITPARSGRYVGYYRMATGAGDKFGQRVWVSFVIPANAPTISNNNNENNNNIAVGGFVPSPASAPSMDVTVD